MYNHQSFQSSEHVTNTINITLRFTEQHCFRLVIYHLGITLKQYNLNRNSALHHNMFSLLCCQQSSRAISKFLTWRQHSTLFRGHDRLVTTAGGMLLPVVPWCLVTRELINGALLIIIIIVAWLKIAVPFHVLWQPLWTTTLVKGFQHHHELDYSSDQVFCLPSWQSPVVRHCLQGPWNPIVQCGQKQTGVADSSNHR